MPACAPRPSWTGGVDATSREYREASVDGADGVVDQIDGILSNLSHHPVGASKEASLFLLTCADTPPVQGVHILGSSTKEDFEIG